MAFVGAEKFSEIYIKEEEGTFTYDTSRVVGRKRERTLYLRFFRFRIFYASVERNATDAEVPFDFTHRTSV